MMNITFKCASEDFGVIPQPYPASKDIPDWFKALPPKLNTGFQASTVKRCLPFLDALTTGWIIPLAADVYFKTNDDASQVVFEWKFHKTMIETHSREQIDSESKPNPVKSPAIKFMNYWMIDIEDGYDILFMPPLNRHNPNFHIFSGLVESPYSGLEYVNFPGQFTKANFDGILPAGTPLVQIIPIKKISTTHTQIRPFTEEDIEKTQKLRLQRQVHESLYRDNMHSKNDKNV